MREMKPRRLLSAEDTLQKIDKGMRILIQLGPQVARTHFLVVESLAIDMLLRTPFIKKNIKSVLSKAGSSYILELKPCCF